MEIDDVIEKIMGLTMKIVIWKTAYFQKEFNINGRSPYTLTGRQYYILVTLYKSNINTLSELQNILHISSSSLSIALSKLVDGGYIRKEFPEMGDDARKVYFYVTDNGREVMEEACSRLHIVFKDFFNSLSDSQKDDILICIDKLDSIFDLQ